MGSCLSKKAASTSSLSVAAATANVSVSEVDPTNCKSNDAKKVEKIITHTEEPKKQEEEEGIVKKEIFVIKHRKSHDRDRQSIVAVDVGDEAVNAAGSTSVVRTSSCTKEEVDAILIQCGRLSRSNSSGKAPSSARKYSGSKRSYDFDNHDHVAAVADYDNVTKSKDDDVDDDDDDRRQHRQRHRQSTRPSSSSSQGRRRTPSRERDQQQRSGSRERATNSGSGRRVSRSPGRRSENNQNASSIATPVNGNSTNVNRPGKLVSVPPTVSSLVMDKSNNANNNTGGEPQTTTSIKRISVKRNVGEGSRTAASPRSQSPARANARGSNENQQPSLSRSSSRKAEHSPYRRNPLSEIDPNSLAYPQTASNKAPCNNQAPMQKPNVENKNERNDVQGTNYKSSSRSTPNNKAMNPNHTTKEQQQIVEEAKTQPPITTHVTVAASGAESLKPQTLTRSRSSRLSRDLDLNPEILLNPTPSYTTLLLEDIQNFHQKNTPSFSLPPCVTKACSILEAVADLNSTTSSNLSCAFSEDRKDQSNKNGYNISSVGKKISEAKDPFVESEVVGSDDLMEPSFHKYVTVRRGGTLGEDMEEQESSGSNSVVGGGQQHWGLSSSSWEPNSADSTDRWTSRSNTREEDQSPLGFQRHALSESGRDVNETRKKSSGKKRDSDKQHTGIGRGRIGAASKGLHTVPIVAAAAST